MNTVKNTSIFFIDGGLLNNHKKIKANKVAYSSIREYVSAHDMITTDIILTMIRESAVPDSIAINEHMFLKQWESRKTLQTTFNVEKFTIIQVLHIILNNKMLETNKKIVIAFDNKSVYNILNGIMPSKKVAYNIYVREALRLLRVLKSKCKDLDKKVLLKHIPRQDIKIVLGH